MQTKQKKYRFYLIISSFILFLSCANSEILNKLDTLEINEILSFEMNDLQTGDFLFVTASTESLSGAINRTTRTEKLNNFDHVGIIQKLKDTIYVLHATTNGGSKKQSIHDFIITEKELNKELVVYRLKPEYTFSIKRAIKKANQLLNMPYNWSYILNDNSLYCSDYIEKIFREDRIFDLIAMNFKNDETNKYDDFWINYYKDLKIDIPQGLPGTNPNQLASSDKLMRLGLLKLE